MHSSRRSLPVLALRWIGLNASIALAYFVLGSLGLALALPPGFSSAIWPAAGLAFAVTALWGGQQVAFGLFVGSALTNATVGGGFHLNTVAVGIAFGSTLQALVGGFWLNRTLPNMTLDRPERIMRFSMVGLASSVIAASVGNLVLLSQGFIGISQIPQSFLTWWLGDAFGVQIFAPLTLLVLAPNPTWRLRRWSVGIPLVVSFLLCGLVYYFVLVSEEQRLMSTFSAQVERFESQLQSLDHIQGQTLRQLADNYNSRATAPGREFAELATKIHRTTPFFRAVSWSPLLSQADRSKLRYPPNFKPHPNGLAAPVAMIFPRAGNEGAIGVDLMGESLRAQTVLKALDTHELAMTKPIPLAQDPTGPGAALLMAPVYKGATHGVVVAVLDMRMIEQSLQDIQGIVWQLSEVSALGTQVLLKSKDVALPEFSGSTHLDRRGVYKQISFAVADRQWHFVLHLPHAELVRHSGQAPLLVMVLALFSCGIVPTFALIMSCHRERVEAQVLEQTHELALARDAAESAALAKGQFLANMSHEIRTPMNAILGLLQLLQSTDLTTRQRDYTNKTEGAAKSLLVLINDILDFSKVEAGKMTMESLPVQIDSLLRNLSVVLSSNVKNRDIDVLFDIDPAIPEWVMGDGIRLQQVLTNLCGNAIKFTAEGYVILSVYQRRKTDHTVTLEFTIKDTGIGIAAEHQEHIFSGFSQAEGSTTRRFGGSGLGLAISKRFVELMGGHIELASTVGVGSTFSFTLEFLLAPPMPLDKDAALVTAALPGRVLVVDDQPMAGALTRRMAQSWGCDAVLAESGRAALDLLAGTTPLAAGECSFPLVLVDWKMPAMDGWETTRRIREYARSQGLRQPTVIMLATLGREMLSHRSEAEQAMIDGFLVKPVTASMVRDAFMEATAGAPSLRQHSQGRSSQRRLGGMRVLVVEDNLINQQVAEELLTSEGAIVSLASNGQLGVEAIAAASPPYDAVLMDVQMPVLDGYAATRVIREKMGLNQLPIIAMTANAMASDRSACLAAGMNEHIGKPFELAQLISLLIRLTGHVSPVDSETSPTDAAQVPIPAPEIAGLDLGAALNRMSGMHTLYVRTAQDFAATLPTVIAEVRQGLAADDRDLVSRCLHTLKGNAATLGARALADEAGTMERLSKAGETWPQVAGLVDALAATAEHTQNLLEQAVKHLAVREHPAEQPSPLSSATPEQIDAALHELRALCAAADLAALERFAELQTTLSPLPGDMYERLEAAIQQLDLQGAQSLCDQILAQRQPQPLGT